MLILSQSMLKVLTQINSKHQHMLLPNSVLARKADSPQKYSRRLQRAP